MRLPLVSRFLIVCASMLMLGALAMPLWRVSLVAPQYPEGLGMTIHANTVRGASENDLRSINSLNHYIGMKAIEPETIRELQVIPWLIVGLAASGLVVAAIGRRPPAVAWLITFVAFGGIGLWDFYRWEYSYGHDLDVKHAIIKVPGMSYQPPLIGSKQLLNFTATSRPEAGTVLLGVAFVLGLAAVVIHGNRRAAQGVV